LNDEICVRFSVFSASQDLPLLLGLKSPKFKELKETLAKRSLDDVLELDEMLSYVGEKGKMSGFGLLYVGAHDRLLLL